MRFQRASVPNRLSIDAIWRLYRTLKDGLVGDTKEYLVDESMAIMERIDTESFKSSLKQMYGEKINYLEKSPIDIATMFIKGIKKVQLLGFVDFIKALSVESPKR